MPLYRISRLSLIPLLPPEKPNPPRKRSATEPAERQKLRRVHIVIHKSVILSPGNVVEPASQRPIEAERVESFLQMRVQREVLREPQKRWNGLRRRQRRRGQLLLIVHQVERKPGAVLGRIAEIEVLCQPKMIQWHKVQRQKSPGKKTTWRVPRIGARLLCAENRAVDVEVEHLIGARLRADVRAHDHVPFFEHAAQADFK